MSECQKSKPVKVKFDFNYTQLKPDPYSDVEYSFEEIRAMYYKRRYDMQDQIEEKYRRQMDALVDENRRLRDQLTRMSTTTSSSSSSSTYKTSCISRMSSNGTVAWTTTTMNAATQDDYSNLTNVTAFAAAAAATERTHQHANTASKRKMMIMTPLSSEFTAYSDENDVVGDGRGGVDGGHGDDVSTLHTTTINVGDQTSDDKENRMVVAQQLQQQFDSLSTSKSIKIYADSTTTTGLMAAAAAAAAATNMSSSSTSISTSPPPNKMSIYNVEVAGNTLAENTHFSNKTLGGNTNVRHLKEEIKGFFCSNQCNPNDSNTELVDMEVGNEEPKVDKLFLTNQLEFELTNFHPHGSSTKFFKPPTSLMATTTIASCTTATTTDTGTTTKSKPSGDLSAIQDYSNYQVANNAPDSAAAASGKVNVNEPATSESTSSSSVTPPAPAVVSICQVVKEIEEQKKAEENTAKQSVLEIAKEIRSEMTKTNEETFYRATQTMTSATRRIMSKSLEWDDDQYNSESIMMNEEAKHSKSMMGSGGGNASSSMSQHHHHHHNQLATTASASATPLNPNGEKARSGGSGTNMSLTTMLNAAAANFGDDKHLSQSQQTQQQHNDDDKPKMSPLNDDDDDHEEADEKGASAAGVAVLTRDKLESSFHTNYYKLAFSMNESVMNISHMDPRNNQSKLANENEETALKKINEDEETRMDATTTEEEQASVVAVDKSATAMITKSRIDDDDDDEEDATTTETTMTATTTHIGIGGGGEIDENTGSSSSSSSSATTSTNHHLSETILTAVREPFDFDVRARLLERGPIERLKKASNYAKFMANAPRIAKKCTVTVRRGCIFTVIDEIDSGAYAKIYLVEDKDGTKKALKVDCKPVAWEFYITETLHERLEKLMRDNEMKVNVMDSYVRMHEFFKYNDSCLSTMDFYSRGNLLNLVNYHINNNETFPYWFVLYLTLEMLCILLYLHKCKIIHTDIKPDNMLIHTLPDSLDYFDQSRTKCLLLIDFNRAIDMNLLPDETEFNSAKGVNKSLLCSEMKEDKPWTYQVDFYGILTCIHCIAFKSFMNVFNENGRFRMSKTFPRSFDKLFGQMFDSFLNIPSCQEMPDLQRDWIDKFLVLFKNELAISYGKSKPYLAKLNASIH